MYTPNFYLISWVCAPVPETHSEYSPTISGATTTSGAI
uniref:WSSV066 n=1 Tax=White spot syndrome virus TaxID=342409 RepID=A0A3G5BHH6_9VIRU|nr:wssv108 [White spot syndrome virus]AYV99387.1 WSSV066 [White spot syndrome virus]